MQVLAVVVRYETPLAESETLRGLTEAFAADPELLGQIAVLVWDNSPDRLDHPQLPFPFEYRHTSENLGVSGAYNRAMGIAEELGCPWMLLLDQDTRITPESLASMCRHASDLLPSSEIAAIAPTVRVGDKVVSPKQQLFLINRDYPIGESGVASGEAICINSGCIMRVASLRKIGGFSEDFWLDYSDLYVFHQFYLHGLKTWRASGALLQHEMTIMDYDRLMTPWRYRNFTDAETAFHDLYRGPIEGALHTMRLFARAIRQRFRYKNPEFSNIAWRQWLYKIRVPKRRRVAEWRAINLTRQLPARGCNPAG